MTQTKIDELNKARTNILNAYLELFEENLNRAKQLGGLDYDLYIQDSKVIRIQVGRRMGTSTWVKNYLINSPNSTVICTEDFKNRMYKDLEAYTINNVTRLLPTAFKDRVIFIDLPPAKVDSALDALDGFLYYCKCLVIV